MYSYDNTLHYHRIVSAVPTILVPGEVYTVDLTFDSRLGPVPLVQGLPRFQCIGSWGVSGLANIAVLLCTLLTPPCCLRCCAVLYGGRHCSCVRKHWSGNCDATTSTNALLEI